MKLNKTQNENARTFLYLLNEFKNMSNAELAWQIYQTKERGEMGALTVFDQCFDEILERLYPDFDGENIVYDDLGWITKDGERLTTYKKMEI